MNLIVICYAYVPTKDWSHVLNPFDHFQSSLFELNKKTLVYVTGLHKYNDISDGDFTIMRILSRSEV